MSDWIKQFDAIAKERGLRWTFSINCHSGIASFVEEGHQCGCKRCLTDRGETWTDETEAQAERDSKAAQLAFKAHTLKWMKAQGLL